MNNINAVPAQSISSNTVRFFPKCWLGRVVQWIKDTFISPLLDLFRSIFCCSSSNELPNAVSAKMRPYILPHPVQLNSAKEDVISKPLPRIGNTCYLNASLQMIASLNTFNEMLIPIPDTPPSDLESLRGHLAAIIHKMRSPDSQDLVSKRDLRVLFHLLQVCGWRHSTGEQNDPHEFLARLKQTLRAPDNSTSEVNISIHMDHLRQSTATSMEEFLFQDGQLSSIRTTLPKTLFIQEKRFGFDQQSQEGYRIGIAVPHAASFSPILTIQPEQEGAQPIHYALKATINHLGGRSSSSGHYTAIKYHRYQDHPIWVHYNDNASPIGYCPSEANALPEAAQQIVQPNAYYLAYEKIEDGEQQ